VPGRFLFKLGRMKAKQQWLYIAMALLTLLGFAMFLLSSGKIQLNLGWHLPWWCCFVFFLGAGVCSFYAVKLGDKAEKQRALMHMAGRESLDHAQFGKQFFPGERAEIAAQLREIVAHHIPVDLSQMHPNDRFVQDLRMDALDSLSTVECVIEIEEKFEIKIPDSAAEKLLTFKDVVDYVSEAVKSKAV
jgi:acyl carrier protein